MASGQSGDRQKKRGRRLKNVFLLYNNRRNTKYNRRKQKIKKKNQKKLFFLKKMLDFMGNLCIIINVV